MHGNLRFRSDLLLAMSSTAYFLGMQLMVTKKIVDDGTLVVEIYTGVVIKPFQKQLAALICYSACIHKVLIHFMLYKHI
jgi:hypothetical protein